MRGCPFHSSGGDPDPESEGADADERELAARRSRRRSNPSRGIDRRTFAKAALTIGGTNALSTLVSARGMPDARGGDPNSLPERQHAWHDVGGIGEHNVFLFLEYDGRTVTGDRRRFDQALRNLERTYEWGSDGLLFTVSYSRAYFERHFGEGPVGLPPDVFPHPEDTIDDVELPHEATEPDTQDILIHLSSNHCQHVLAAELAMFPDSDGELSHEIGCDPGSVPSNAKIDRIFSIDQRRTGFVGAAKRRDPDHGHHTSVKYPRDDEPDDPEAPLFMGFHTGFSDNQATEATVTLTDTGGGFDQGTLHHVSRLHLDRSDDAGSDLQGWYDEFDDEDRIDRMFSPEHHVERRSDDDMQAVGKVGRHLVEQDHSGLTEEIVDATEHHARTAGVVGHAAKAARGRDDDFDPLILRRDTDSTDPTGELDVVAVNFNGLMHSIEHFVAVRTAMNRVSNEDADENENADEKEVEDEDEDEDESEGEGKNENDDADDEEDEDEDDRGGLDERERHADADADTQEPVAMDHGILGFMDVARRGNFLIPPRAHRALPPADP